MRRGSIASSLTLSAALLLSSTAGAHAATDDNSLGDDGIGIKVEITPRPTPSPEQSPAPTLSPSPEQSPLPELSPTPMPLPTPDAGPDHLTETGSAAPWALSALGASAIAAGILFIRGRRRAIPTHPDDPS